ncbi:MAG: DsbA family oxidoreductase [Polyangiaceae bacterium]
MQIDFVSDIACPWCAIGLNALERALENVPELDVELRPQPFELNPSMPKAGEDTGEYLRRKYGMSAAQLEASQAMLKQRGAEVGFTFGERTRIWNTFDAHRLIHWAGTIDPKKQRALVHALFRAYHGEGKDPSDPNVLAEAAQSVSLDNVEARKVIAEGTYAAEVRSAMQTWREAGITAVPSVIIDDRHLIQGGQPVKVFEQALVQLSA